MVVHFYTWARTWIPGHTYEESSCLCKTLILEILEEDCVPDADAETSTLFQAGPGAACVTVSKQDSSSRSRTVSFGVTLFFGSSQLFAL